MPIAKILLVDAAADARRRAPDTLIWAEVLAAATIAEALPLAEQERPDLVLLNAEPVDLDVASVVGQFARQQPGDPPVVIIMAPGGDSDERYRQAGAAGVVAKPLDRASSDRLKALFTEARMNRQFAHLRELGGEEFVGEMIDLFLGFAPRQIDEAKRALAGGQIDGVRRAAHSLKAGAANLGAELVRELAGRIEALAAKNQAQNLPTLLDSLDASFRRLRERLEHYKS